MQHLYSRPVSGLNFDAPLSARFEFLARSSRVEDAVDAFSRTGIRSGALIPMRPEQIKRGFPTDKENASEFDT